MAYMTLTLTKEQESWLENERKKRSLLSKQELLRGILSEYFLKNREELECSTHGQKKKPVRD